MVRSRSPKFRSEKSSWDVSRTRSQWHEQATESDRSSRESSPDTSSRSKSGPSTALNISARGGPSNTDGSRGRARHRSQIVGVPLVTKSIGHGRQVLVPDESGSSNRPDSSRDERAEATSKLKPTKTQARRTLGLLANGELGATTAQNPSRTAQSHSETRSERDLASQLVATLNQAFGHPGSSAATSLWLRPHKSARDERGRRLVTGKRYFVGMQPEALQDRRPVSAEVSGPGTVVELETPRRVVKKKDAPISSYAARLRLPDPASTPSGSARVDQSKKLISITQYAHSIAHGMSMSAGGVSVRRMESGGLLAGQPVGPPKGVKKGAPSALSGEDSISMSSIGSKEARQVTQLRTPAVKPLLFEPNKRSKEVDGSRRKGKQREVVGDEDEIEEDDGMDIDEPSISRAGPSRTWLKTNTPPADVSIHRSSKSKHKTGVRSIVQNVEPLPGLVPSRVGPQIVKTRSSKSQYRAGPSKAEVPFKVGPPRGVRASSRLERSEEIIPDSEAESELAMGSSSDLPLRIGPPRGQEPSKGTAAAKAGPSITTSDAGQRTSRPVASSSTSHLKKTAAESSRPASALVLASTTNATPANDIPFVPFRVGVPNKTAKKRKRKADDEASSARAPPPPPQPSTSTSNPPAQAQIPPSHKDTGWYLDAMSFQWKRRTPVPAPEAAYASSAGLDHAGASGRAEATKAGPGNHESSLTAGDGWARWGPVVTPSVYTSAGGPAVPLLKQQQQQHILPQQYQHTLPRQYQNAPQQQQQQQHYFVGKYSSQQQSSNQQPYQLQPQLQYTDVTVPLKDTNEQPAANEAAHSRGQSVPSQGRSRSRSRAPVVAVTRPENLTGEISQQTKRSRPRKQILVPGDDSTVDPKEKGKETKSGRPRGRPRKQLQPMERHESNSNGEASLAPMPPQGEEIEVAHILTNPPVVPVPPTRTIPPSHNDEARVEQTRPQDTLPVPEYQRREYLCIALAKTLYAGLTLHTRWQFAGCFSELVDPRKSLEAFVAEVAVDVMQKSGLQVWTDMVVASSGNTNASTTTYMRCGCSLAGPCGGTVSVAVGEVEGLLRGARGVKATITVRH